MKKLMLLLLPLGMLALASCSSEEALTARQDAAEKQAVAIRPLIQNNTRGESVNLANLKEFGVIAKGEGLDGGAWKDNVTDGGDGSSWNTNSVHYWTTDASKENSTASFTGFYPTTLNVTTASTDVALDFSALTNGNDQVDHLVAFNTGTKASNADNGVALNFKHVLSKVVIKIDNQTTQEITAVSFLNVANAAQFNLASAGDEVASSVGEVQPSIKAVKGNNDGDKLVYQLLIVPQSAQPQIQLETSEGVYLYSLASAFSFAKGKKYTAEVALTPSTTQGGAAVTFTLQVTDWEEADENPVFGTQEQTVFKDKWTVIGKIMGADWDKDFEMTDNQDNSWSITITYAAGDAFKFRFNGEWTYQYGMWASDSNDTITLDAINATTADNKTYGMADNSENQANKDIMLPEAGTYTLKLFTFGEHAGDLYVTKN